MPRRATNDSLDAPEPQLPAKVRQKRKMAPPRMPGQDVASVREMILADAQFDHTTKVKVLKACLESAVNDLEAVKRQPLTYQGRLMDVFEQPDHTARAKAREQLMDVIGVSGPPDAPAKDAARALVPAPWMIQVNVDSKKATKDPITVSPEPSQGCLTSDETMRQTPKN